MGDLLQDLKYTLRWLTRNRSFASVAVLLLGLGLGGGAMAFNVIQAVLLRPLPYYEPNRLALLWESLPAMGYDQLRISGPEYLDYRERSEAFADIAAFRFMELTVTGSHEPFTLEGLGVTSNLFSVLGAGARRGRVFGAEESRSWKPEVILSYGVWRQRFGKDPRIIGRSLTLNGEPHTVIGVMPETFRFPPPFTLGDRTYNPTVGSEIFILLAAGDLRLHREQRNLMALGCLRPGFTARQANQEVASLARRLSEQYPDDNPKGLTAIAVPLAEGAVGRARPMLFLLATAVGLVLVIACANVASFLATRACSRGREMALRSTLGASRFRLMRQLLTESLVVGIAGGALAILLTAWSSRLVSSIEFLGIPRLNEVRLDAAGVGFVLLLALVTSLLFGLAPILYLIRPHLAQGLHAATKGVSSSGKTIGLQRKFVALQLAFSLILLAASGLAGVSLWRLNVIDLGFQPKGLQIVSLSFPDYRYPEKPRLKEALDEVLRRVQALPGVQSASAASGLPLTALLDSTSFTVEGREPPRSPEEQTAVLIYVTRDYFESMGIRLLNGRLFDRSDEMQGPRRVLISQSLARRYWQGQKAVGRRLVLNQEIAGDPLEIIGIVNDVKVRDLKRASEPVIYLPFAASYSRRAVLIVRPRLPGMVIAPQIRHAIWSVDPELPLQASTMKERVEASFSQPRFAAVLLGLLTGLAVCLAITGTHAVVSYVTIQRRHEIGIRLAVGSTRSEVVRMLVRSGTSTILAGVAVGFLGTVASNKLISASIYGIVEDDLWVLTAAASGLVFATGLIATYLAARRAAPENPLPLLNAS